MKKLTIVLIGLLIGFYSDFIQSQEKMQPFVISPFIDDKLDKVEEDYFKIFPTLTDFQEAVFYINPDSSLNVKIKARFRNVLIDTMILYGNSLEYLRNIINQKIITDIKQNKVKELKLYTFKDTTFDGTVYSYENRKIRFIKKGFMGVNNADDEENYLMTLKYYDVNTITASGIDPSITSSTTVLGFITGGIIVSLFGPKGTGWFKPLQNIGYFLIGGAIGGIAGYLIGNSIKIPVEYDTLDPEAENILYENALLTK